MPLSPPVINENARSLSDSTQIEVPSYLNVSIGDVLKFEVVISTGERSEHTINVTQPGQPMTFEVPNDWLRKNAPNAQINTRVTVTRPSGNFAVGESTLDLKI